MLFSPKKCVCECVQALNKKEQVKAILKELLDRTQGKLQFGKDDLEKAIMSCRGCDKRTLKNWVEYLWKLEYINQPLPQYYEINIVKASELELEIPDLKQTHLFQPSTHTHIIQKS